jgi:hypothetical protein
MVSKFGVEALTDLKLHTTPRFRLRLYQSADARTGNFVVKKQSRQAALECVGPGAVQQEADRQDDGDTPAL